jgi:hypothetical protein
MDKWVNWHQESEEARWQRFHSSVSQSTTRIAKTGSNYPNPFEKVQKRWQDLYQSHPGRNVRQLLRARKTLDEKPSNACRLINTAAESANWSTGKSAQKSSAKLFFGLEKVELPLASAHVFIYLEAPV